MRFSLVFQCGRWDSCLLWSLRFFYYFSFSLYVWGTCPWFPRPISSAVLLLLLFCLSWARSDFDLPVSSQSHWRDELKDPERMRAGAALYVHVRDMFLMSVVDLKIVVHPCGTIGSFVVVFFHSRATAGNSRASRQHATKRVSTEINYLFVFLASLASGSLISGSPSNVFHHSLDCLLLIFCVCFSFLFNLAIYKQNWFRLIVHHLLICFEVIIIFFYFIIIY